MSYLGLIEIMIFSIELSIFYLMNIKNELIIKFHKESKNHGVSALISNLVTSILYPFDIFRLRIQSKSIILYFI